jgi:two-component system phosphate regulon sensor histidine kinase PhoR
LVSQTNRDKAQLLAVLSSMSEGVIATDTRQRIVLCNAAAATMLNLSHEQAPGKLLWEAVRRQPIIDAADSVLTQCQRANLRLEPAAGRHLDVALCTFPPNAAPDGLLIVVHDTTEAVRYEELRKEFVANVSHELRTPLSAIQGFAETLCDGALNDPVRAPQYLGIIRAHADQLSNLVNDLLDISRLESPGEPPKKAPVDLTLIVQKVADLLRPAAEKRGQTLDVHAPPPSQLVVHGNADYLERAVANLLDNAIKYTPDAGSISVSVACEGAEAVVEVKDNGVGIPVRDLPRVFERFYRVDRSRSRAMGGTGLGLSIVKHIAQEHRGSVEVASKPGQGSSFKLRLPLNGIPASDSGRA